MLLKYQSKFNKIIRIEIGEITNARGVLSEIYWDISSIYIGVFHRKHIENIGGYFIENILKYIGIFYQKLSQI